MDLYHRLAKASNCIKQSQIHYYTHKRTGEKRNEMQLYCTQNCSTRLITHTMRIGQKENYCTFTCANTYLHVNLRANNTATFSFIFVSCVWVGIWKPSVCVFVFRRLKSVFDYLLILQIHICLYQSMIEIIFGSISQQNNITTLF